MTDATPQPQMSVQLINFFASDPGTWTPLIERAQLLDRAGIDRLVVSDHVVMGTDLDAYAIPEAGGIEGGRQPTGPDGIWLEPMTLLSVLAGVTERIRLGTAVLLAGLRRPVVLAKAAGTLDTLSGGRLDLGVGVGWQRAEYEAAGLDYHKRGATLDRTLDILAALWSEPPASYSSPELTFDDVYVVPGPARASGIPIWISGRINPRVVARIVAHGSGWIPWGDAAGDPTDGIAVLRKAMEAADRDPASLQVVGRLPTVRNPDRSMNIEATMEAVPSLVGAGVTDFRVSPTIPDDPEEALASVSEVVRAFREVTDTTK